MGHRQCVAPLLALGRFDLVDDAVGADGVQVFLCARLWHLGLLARGPHAPFLVFVVRIQVFLVVVRVKLGARHRPEPLHDDVASLALGHFDERVLEKLRRARPAVLFLDQTRLDKRHKALRPLVLIRESGGWTRCDRKQGPNGSFVCVWWLPLRHLNGCDAERPNVDLDIVRFFLDHFRRHPVRCADGCPPQLVDVIGDLRRNAEVGKFALSFRV
mmetsp:Transcript_43402/g.109597  ORF Transcript_43402/g.109597 Transcript_43402/m.109597 type:complete len:215 (+) Transcript_43402:1574-2218(+)